MIATKQIRFMQKNLFYSPILSFIKTWKNSISQYWFSIQFLTNDYTQSFVSPQQRWSRRASANIYVAVRVAPLPLLWRADFTKKIRHEWIWGAAPVYKYISRRGQPRARGLDCAVKNMVPGALFARARASLLFFSFFFLHWLVRAQLHTAIFWFGGI